MAEGSDDSAVRAGAFCFDTGRAIPPLDTISLRLADRHAEALALLVPLIGCGEEAATLAFEGLAGRAANREAASALRHIAQEEQVHDGLLKQLARALPPSPSSGPLQAAARRYHIRLMRGGADMHLARIAALDSAVCTILTRFIDRRRPLGKEATTSALFGRIRNDEARHVSVSRRLAIASGPLPALRDGAAAARVALADILRLGSGAFEALEVDPDALDRAVRRLPDGLLAA